jgi:hypothetical protein
MPCIIYRAQTGVDADVGLRSEHLAVTQKLVCAKAVALEIVPRQIDSRRTLIFGPNPVFPVVARIPKSLPS